MIEEEAPTNSVSGGNIAGVTGEPPVKKCNGKNKMFRRKSFKDFIQNVK